MPHNGMRRKQWGAGMLPWARLLRLPNVFTAPGDPLAGALLAAAANGSTCGCFTGILTCIMVSVALYCSGLILNDLCDLPKDRRLRPERPLPRGDISVGAAWGAYWVLLGVALLLAASLGRSPFLIACLLAGTICVYNTLAKQDRLKGALAMGLCRALSLALGASLYPPRPTPILCAVILWVFIAVVTWIAWDENRAHCPGRIAMVPGSALLLTWVVRLPALDSGLFFFLIGSIPLAMAFFESHRLGKELSSRTVPAATIQASIGAFLRTLPAWQLFLVLSASAPGRISAAVFLGVCWACSRVLGKHISQS